MSVTLPDCQSTLSSMCSWETSTSIAKTQNSSEKPKTSFPSSLGRAVKPWKLSRCEWPLMDLIREKSLIVSLQLIWRKMHMSGEHARKDCLTRQRFKRVLSRSSNKMANKRAPERTLSSRASSVRTDDKSRKTSKTESWMLRFKSSPQSMMLQLRMLRQILHWKSTTRSLKNKRVKLSESSKTPTNSFFRKCLVIDSLPRRNQTAWIMFFLPYSLMMTTNKWGLYSVACQITRLKLKKRRRIISILTFMTTDFKTTKSIKMIWITQSSWYRYAMAFSSTGIPSRCRTVSESQRTPFQGITRIA